MMPKSTVTRVGGGGVQSLLSMDLGSKTSGDSQSRFNKNPPQNSAGGGYNKTNQQNNFNNKGGNKPGGGNFNQMPSTRHSQNAGGMGRGQQQGHGPRPGQQQSGMGRGGGNRAPPPRGPPQPMANGGPQGSNEEWQKYYQEYYAWHQQYAQFYAQQGQAPPPPAQPSRQVYLFVVIGQESGVKYLNKTMTVLISAFQVKMQKCVSVFNQSVFEHTAIYF